MATVRFRLLYFNVIALVVLQYINTTIIAIIIRHVRMDHHSKNGYITAAYMLAAFSRSGLHLSKQATNLIITNYALPESEASPMLEVCNYPER